MKSDSKPTSLSEDTLWEAVINRDADFNGICFYGVMSTGIYCRFHCSSKRPVRKNVRFFFSIVGAQNAGFKPCKKCHPEKITETNSEDSFAKVITACRYIESCDHIPSLQEISLHVDLSRFYLQKVFKKLLGISPKEYADIHRQDRFKKALNNGREIAVASFTAGYGSSSRVYEQTNSRFGMTPGEYKEKGKGQTIYYSVVKSGIGSIIIARTTKGICAVRIGDSKLNLIDELKTEFEKANIYEAPEELSGWTQKIINYISGKIFWPKLPYDVKATVFQRKVWDCLRTIPEGETKNYNEIAKLIGRPKATRAVANACASNPVALIVPCHRVVPKSGNVGGYRWGTERKKKLLIMEKLNTLKK